MDVNACSFDIFTLPSLWVPREARIPVFVLCYFFARPSILSRTTVVVGLEFSVEGLFRDIITLLAHHERRLLP